MVEYIRNPNTNCCVCHKPVYKRPSQIKLNHGKVYCGLECYGISCRREKPCIICGKPVLAGLNKKTCSRSCSNKLRIGTHYHGGYSRSKVKNYQSLKMRLIAQRGKKCERCGYGKLEILQVHHVNKDRNNNELSNLELICPNCHYEEHLLQKSWMKTLV